MNVTYNKTIRTCMDINVEISEVDHYTWIFNSRIFRLALEITFLLNKYFFLQMTYELHSQSKKLNKRAGGVLIRAARGKGWKRFWKEKVDTETLIRDLRVIDFSCIYTYTCA